MNSVLEIFFCVELSLHCSLFLFPTYPSILPSYTLLLLVLPLSSPLPILITTKQSLNNIKFHAACMHAGTYVARDAEPIIYVPFLLQVTSVGEAWAVGFERFREIE